jgi:O-antigen/teichoic acid export membrane protein
MAVTGIVLNSLVARFFDASILGSFNILYALYIVLSQLCALGIHYSCIRHLAITEETSSERHEIFASAFVLSLLVAFLFSCIVFKSSIYISQCYAGQLQDIEIQIIALSVGFFAVNKILLGGINGLSMMRAYAVFLSIRYLFMMMFACIIILVLKNASYLPYIFFLSEVLLFAVLYVFIFWSLKIKLTQMSMRWIKRHFFFGLKAFFVGIFLELNTRIDVLILGYFVDIKKVGIYSLAAMVAEGTYQVLVVIRNIINPSIAKFIESKDLEGLSVFIQNLRKKIYRYFALFTIVVLFAYPIYVYLILADNNYLYGIWPLLILLGGIYFASGIIPFDNILTQSNFPIKQTMYSLVGVVGNLVLNIILVPHFSVIGSALATTVANYIIAILYLEFTTRKQLGFSLLKGSI